MWRPKERSQAMASRGTRRPGPGALIYLGCNGRGVPLGTAMGHQLARLIGGETAEINMPITSLRPIRFHALWPVAVKSVALYGRIRDRLAQGKKPGSRPARRGRRSCDTGVYAATAPATSEAAE